MSPAKAARISPESRPVAYAAAGIAAAIYLGAFAASFFGLASLAAFMAIPVALQYVVPAVIDLALILFTLATLLRRARGQSTWMTNTATAFWILISMAANTFHVLVAAGPASGWGAGTYAGAALSALMPVAALGGSLVLENLFIEGPTPAEKSATAAAPVVAPVAPIIAAVKGPAPEPTKLHAVPRLAVAAASAPRTAVVASVATPPKARPSTTDPKAEWEAASESERASIALAMKADNSNQQIADTVGVSLSSVKRTLAKAAQEKLLAATA